MFNISYKEKQILFYSLLFSLFLAALDQTIITTAAPFIIKDFNEMKNYFWIISSYLISSVITLPIFGRFCDIISIKFLIIISNLFFLIGSFLCAFSNDLFQLSVFRFIQGIGGGGIFAVAFTSIGILYPPRERGKIQGWISSIFGISSILGPMLGSIITNFFSWHWVFLINIPFGIFVSILMVWFFPKVPALSNQEFDTLGSFLFVFGSLMILLMLNIPQLSLKLRIFFVSFGIFFYLLFYFYEIKIKHPLFEFKLFQDRTFLTSGVATFFLGGVFISILIFFPLYLTKKYHLDSIQTGNQITLLSICVVLSSIISGRISSYTGKYKTQLILSNLWLLLIFLLIFFINISNILIFLEIWLIILIGIGFGPILPLYVLAVQNSVSKKRLGTATSSIQFLRQLGASFGSSFFGFLYYFFVSLYEEKGIILYFLVMIMLNFLFVLIAFVFTVMMPDLDLKNSHLE